jgi:S-(hydroxymethyl)glutathione dehydrogenase/alcohol dehydrogenase
MRTRAAIIREINTPWEVTTLELDPPGDKEVLVRFVASGLCHSDEHNRTGATPGRMPMVGGHEGAGIVEAVGRSVTRVAVGDHIVASFIPACGMCRSCATGHQNLCDLGAEMSTGRLPDGGFRFHDDAGVDFGGFAALGTFSERATLSEYSCIKILPDIPLEVAALAGCGVPTGWGSAVYVADVQVGDSVVVFGAGGVGANAVQGAAHAGARHLVVVDPVAIKREFAQELGATHTFSNASSATDAVREITWGAMADHAIITVGMLTAEIMDAAVNIIGKNAQVTITSVGHNDETQIKLSTNHSVVAPQRRIQGHLFGMCNPLYDVPRLLNLYRDGQLKLDELITNRYPLDDINRATKDLMDGRNIRGIIVHDS